MTGFAIRASVVMAAFLAGASVSVWCAFKLADRIWP